MALFEFVARGDVVTITTPVATTVGVPVAVGSLIGVALNTVAAGERVDVSTGGVFQAQKVAAEAISLGAPVYWNGSLVTTTAAGNTRIGTALEDRPAGSAYVDVRLIQL